MRKLQGGENQQPKAKWVADVRIIFEVNVSRLRLQSCAALCLVFKAVGKMKTWLSHRSQSRFTSIALEHLLNPPLGAGEMA